MRLEVRSSPLDLAGQLAEEKIDQTGCPLPINPQSMKRKRDDGLGG